MRQLISLLLCLTLYSTNSAANESISVVTEEGVLQYTQGDQIVGPATVIVKGVLDKTPYSYQIKSLPWTRAYNAALQQPNTLIYSIIRNPEREQMFHWVGKIAQTTFSLYALKSSKIKITNMEEARHYSIGVVRDDVSHFYLTDKKFTKLSFVSNFAQNIKKFNSGRFELVILQSYECKSVKLDCSNFEEVFPLDELSLDFYMAMSKQTPSHVIKRVKQSYQKFNQKNHVEKIIEQFFQSQ